MAALPARNQVGSRNAKHGFPLAGAPAPGGLGWRIRKTMLIRFAAPVEWDNRVTEAFPGWAVNVLSMVSGLVGGLWWEHFPEVQA